MIADMEEKFGKFDGFIYKPRAQKSVALTYGVGLNDAPFTIEPTNNFLGKRKAHPAYVVWKDMLARCYSKKYKEKYPTYQDVTCSDDWLIFSNFAMWFKDNFKEGHHLDKDLLVKGNRKYGPDTCLFVPRHINLFLSTRQGINGAYPLGVCFDSSKKNFTASINLGDLGKKNLGCFNSQQEAHRAWQIAKLNRARSFNYIPLQRIIDQLTYEIENNLETKSLC